MDGTGTIAPNSSKGVDGTLVIAPEFSKGVIGITVAGNGVTGVDGIIDVLLPQNMFALAPVRTQHSSTHQLQVTIDSKGKHVATGIACGSDPLSYSTGWNSLRASVLAHSTGWNTLRE